jgi:hypothetical protein
MRCLSYLLCFAFAGLVSLAWAFDEVNPFCDAEGVTSPVLETCRPSVALLVHKFGKYLAKVWKSITVLQSIAEYCTGGGWRGGMDLSL